MRQDQDAVWAGAARRTCSTSRQDHGLLSVWQFAFRAEGELGGVLHVWIPMRRHCSGSFPTTAVQVAAVRLQIWHGPDLEASPPAHNWLKPVGPIYGIVA